MYISSVYCIRENDMVLQLYSVVLKPVSQSRQPSQGNHSSNFYNLVSCSQFLFIFIWNQYTFSLYMTLPIYIMFHVFESQLCSFIYISSLFSLLCYKHNAIHLVIMCCQTNLLFPVWMLGVKLP